MLANNVLLVREDLVLKTLDPFDLALEGNHRGSSLKALYLFKNFIVERLRHGIHERLNLALRI